MSQGTRIELDYNHWPEYQTATIHVYNGEIELRFDQPRPANCDGPGPDLGGVRVPEADMRLALGRPDHTGKAVLLTRIAVECDRLPDIAAPWTPENPDTIKQTLIRSAAWALKQLQDLEERENQ